MSSGFGVRLAPWSELQEDERRWWDRLAPIAAQSGVTEIEVVLLEGLCQQLALRDQVAEARRAEGLFSETAEGGRKRTGVQEDLLKINRAIAETLKELALSRIGRQRLAEVIGQKRLRDERAKQAGLHSEWGDDLAFVEAAIN